MSEPVVLYEERGSVAVVTLNRPKKLNTLTEEMVQGVADAIDRATASRPVRSVILRGAVRTLTGGYDLDTAGGADIGTRWPNRLRALEDRTQGNDVHDVHDSGIVVEAGGGPG